MMFALYKPQYCKTPNIKLNHFCGLASIMPTRLFQVNQGVLAVPIKVIIV